MNIVEYTQFLVESIAQEKEMVSVKEIGSDENSVHLEVLIKLFEHWFKLIHIYMIRKKWLLILNRFK